VRGSSLPRAPASAKTQATEMIAPAKRERLLRECAEDH